MERGVNMIKDTFGTTKNQETIHKYTLKNDFLSVSILNYGCIIQEILMSDSLGTIDNIVLGYDNIENYEENLPHFGAVIGRTAGRIEDGIFTLDDKKYQLHTNPSGTHLHGGREGLDKKIWKEEKFTDTRLVLSYISEDLEENYPGIVKFVLTYHLENNQLHWSVNAKTNKKTIINLTNHSYFNLSGLKNSGISQELMIASDYFFELKESLIPTGVLLPVTNTPFDFRISKAIKKDIHQSNEQLRIGGGYDHPFLLDAKSPTPIILKDPTSGRKLEIKTDQSTCVFYSGNFLDEKVGIVNAQKIGEKHLGICLETQNPPNAINMEDYKNYVIISPEEEYIHKNTWIFSCEKS